MNKSKQGRSGKPCFMNGKRWPSQTAASKALKVSRAAICKALASDRASVRVGGRGEFV